MCSCLILLLALTLFIMSVVTKSEWFGYGALAAIGLMLINTVIDKR